ncbi:tryptophan--tRNA ligase [Sciscionella sediminilitoris]|uniref:tryptophan--tRNA ligase n=1 Tax=Sciscionella sediminilitoris TaxID=1445613 RepID=UPI0004DEDAB6|nr:tryptophan--tRNA ligase [Sciscionella sp. SE31]
MIRFSGATPSGRVHLGNYLGAIQHWADRAEYDGDLYFVSDLHAMTKRYSPAQLRVLTRELHATLIASGIPADRIFVQSDLLAEHASLSWILECVCTFGEARRMTQFKEKSKGENGVRLGLLTYPTLMAADILLHGAQEVPVGDDQRQHVELARSLARRFNTEYGEVFTVPRAVTPPVGARIMDLAEPSRKMAKSSAEAVGTIFLRDEPEIIERKISRAVTDSSGIVRYAPEEQPGVTNLVDILATIRRENPRELAESITGYAELKRMVTDAVLDRLRPIRKTVEELLADQAELDRLRANAAELAAERARPRLHAAMQLAGIG